MRSKRNAVFIILGLLGQLSLVSPTYAAPIQAPGEVKTQKIYPVALPSKDRLILLSSVPMIVEGELLGGLAFYDDAATKRPADYLELYNNVGALVAVGWFDRFGIQRLAVDRALVKHADYLDGVFVLIMDGDSV